MAVKNSFTFRIEPWAEAWLRKRAEDEGRTPANLIRLIISDYIRRNGGPAGPSGPVGS